MTRFQILLGEGETRALRAVAAMTGKSYSQLVREAVDSVYRSSFSEKELNRFARAGKRLRSRKGLESKEALALLWKL